MVVSPAQALVATSREWGIERWSLAREPGRVVLDRLTSVSAALVGSTGYAPLLGVPSLALTRGIGIVAVSIDPSPLPARAGELLLPPVSSVHLGVSVENAAYVEQPVTLLIRFQPTNGLVQSQTLTATLGPLASFAFVPDQLTTSASERGTLRVTVSGAPAGATLALTRTYRVVMSPSGNG